MTAVEPAREAATGTVITGGEPAGEPAGGTIITFYSYKGGTGRTMALANIAWILAQGGKKVLAVDWDLESPGLHKFFQPFIDNDVVAATPGIIELINDYSWAATTETVQHDAGWHLEYARILPHAVSLNWEFPAGGELDFVSAGRQNRDYSSLVSSMDWDNFYERLGGGQFFDALRTDMKGHYDYALIDSRTGLSDIADICTVQMPDVLVDCFTLSSQSIEGAAAVARHIDERYPNRGIRILPVPMRIENAENEKVEASRAFARAEFTGFPKGMSQDEAARYWLGVEIPYRAFYAFEETLAVFGDAPGSPGSLLAAFERLTGVISEQQVPAFRPIDDDRRLGTLRLFARRRPAEVTEIVLSYVAEDRPWADWIGTTLQQMAFSVLTHCADAQPDGLLREQIRSAPRIMALLSPAYVQSAYASRVWDILTAATPNPAPPQRLTAVRILDARLVAPFAAVAPVDLSGLSEECAADALRVALDRQTSLAEPSPAGPRFPGVPTNPAICNMGARNARFTGRSTELEDLRDHILGGGQPTVTAQALYGLGGVGKTQIALEYAHRFKADYDLIWRIPAEQSHLISTSLAELGRKLRQQARDSVADAADAADTALDALRRGIPSPRWLLIYDNACDVQQLERYLPGGDGHVVITSRNPAWSRVARPLEVPVFSRADSVAYLRRRVPALTAESALRIGTELGFLPLAVEQAAAWLQETGVSAAQYLEMLDKQTAEVLAMGTPVDYPATVASTWDLSLAELRRSSPAAVRMLELCAYFAPDPISLDLIYSDEMARLVRPFDDTVRDNLALGGVVYDLSRFALAKVDQSNHTLQVHRLVQAVVRSRMTPEEQDSTRHDVRSILFGAVPEGGTDDPRNWPMFDKILPHILPSRAAESSVAENRQLVIDVVRYLWKRNNFDQALKLGREIEDKWAAELSPDHRQRLYLQSQLANVLRSQGRYQEAKDKDQDVLSRQLATIGDGDLETWITAGGLAADLRALGRFDEALAMDKETYRRLEEIFGANHPRTLSLANNLAVSYRLVGDYSSARRLDTATLAARTAVLGPDQPDTLLSTAYLAQDMRETGNFDESVWMLRATLQKYRELLGDKTLDSLRIAKSLAVSLRRAGHREEARVLALMTCDLYDKTFPQSPDAISASLEQASCLFAVGQKESARELARRILKNEERTLGPDHPYTLAVAANLAGYLRSTENPKDAYSLGHSTLRKMRSKLGKSHPFALSCAVNVANALSDLGRLKKAEALERDTLGRFRRRLGENHPDTLICQSNLATTLLGMGRREEAARLRESTVEAMARTLGEDHQLVASVRDGERLSRDLESQPI